MFCLQACLFEGVGTHEAGVLDSVGCPVVAGNWTPVLEGQPVLKLPLSHFNLTNYFFLLVYKFVVYKFINVRVCV